MDWRDGFRRDGYAHFKRIVPPALVRAAVDAIHRDLEANYDAARDSEYVSRTWCPGIQGTAPITDLLWRSPFLQVLDEALGADRISHDGGQIVIHRPWARPHGVHIDGFADPQGLNGLEPGRIHSFTALVGFPLTDVSQPAMGNLTVHPGSHREFAEAFRRRGLRALQEPMPEIDPGEPRQLLCEPGDAVLLHYLSAHSCAVNHAAQDRIAVYFRIWLSDIEDEGRRWHYLTHMWDGWRLGSLQPRENDRSANAGSTATV